MSTQPDGRLTLPGVTHNLEVVPGQDSDGLLLRVWSPGVLTGDWAEAVLSVQDRREMAAYLLDGLP